MLQKIKNKIYISLGLTGLIYLAFTIYADYELVYESFSRFPVFIIPLVLLLVFSNYFTRFLKWDYYLGLLNIQIKKRDSFTIFMSGLIMLSLQSAIYKLAKLPAINLKLVNRGELKKGFYADIVVFDPALVNDPSTFEKPHQYAKGMEQVFVNGIQVLKDGNPTGASAGRVVRGPGYKKKN